MQHGKRGFDRLVYGCKNISETSLDWVCTLEDPCKLYYPHLLPSTDKDLADKPITIDQLAYEKVLSTPAISQHVKTHQVITPSMPSFQDNGSEGPDTATELYEWISLVRLGSPRVLYNDSIDPYLSRYSSPNCPPGEMSVSHISCDGFLSSSWVSNLVSTLIVACPEESWFAISATDVAAGGLGGRSEITVLKPPGQSSRYLMWDIKHI